MNLRSFNGVFLRRLQWIYLIVLFDGSDTEKVWNYLNSRDRPNQNSHYLLLLSHTLPFGSHLNPEVEAKMHKSMQIYSQTFPGHIQNPLRGHFPCYAMTSGLLMIGANLPRPTWFLPLLSFPLPPTPFPPGPDTLTPPTPLMSSR